ncbi:DUF6519 domain-containing protein [Aliikangiella sp. IMCC44359]|uniref:DUF6519 domain-containing protein n=1 Tax=Aliikangiella sp. IMCC44359 TaxID=3459125 RepID=UPI00403B2C81
MSFDLSRKTFDPLNDYFGVVMQQGRVQVDADWNTLVDQIKRRIQAGTLDTFLTSVVPRVTPDGFLISGTADAIVIGPGRIYVDGILAENHTTTLKWDARLAELSGTAKLSGADIDAAPSGINGTTAYDAQPYYTNPAPLPEEGNYLVYLDVWQRDVTYLQDEQLVDAAIGVDTTARQQIVWQVKVLTDIGDTDETTEDIDIPGWLNLIHPSSARLTTSIGDFSQEENPCLLPPQSGYKGTAHQLYRVQVHQGGTLGNATFKWSRDNAIVVSKITSFTSAKKLVVDSLGKDDLLSFNEGDWVEITDDYRQLNGIPGELRRIQLGNGINRATRTITLLGTDLPMDGETNGFVDDPARNNRIIRWDQSGSVYQKHADESESVYVDLDDGISLGDITIPASGTKLFLEKGVLVDFSLENVVDEADFDPEFKVGDYWLIAARSNDGSIDLLDQAPPVGEHHHFTKLAIVNENGITDCRTLWPPLTNSESCACTICVHPETHNNGSATIQQAIDQVNQLGGGSICLSVGEYLIREPLQLTGNSVSLKGQGWKTILTGVNPITIIEVGGEGVATDISIEGLFVKTSVRQGVNTAISVKNVFSMNISDCAIVSLAAGRGTSQGIQFLGIAALVDIEQCFVVAEQGILGPINQKEILATLDFNISKCTLACTQYAVIFSGLSFHLNQLEIVNNHLANANNAGIELSGMVVDDTAVNIEHNLLVNCRNGVRSGISDIRINNNDMEVDLARKSVGNGITLIDGYDPEDSDNLQIFGNRIKNYDGHAISVQSAIGKIMVKQNQVESIGGAAFMIEEGGSIDYLTLENNQFKDIDGAFTSLKGYFSGIYLQAVMRADITNNVFDRIVRSESDAFIRAAIAVASSNDVNITGNRFFSITPSAYTGNGVGIFISSEVGSFEINDNQISRIPENEDEVVEKISSARWFPIIILNSRDNQQVATASDNLAAASSARGETHLYSHVTHARSSRYKNSPVVSVRNTAYAVLADRFVLLGATAVKRQNVNIKGNYLDSTSSIGGTGAVSVSVPQYCGFIDNELRSTTEGLLAAIYGDHVIANNNRMTTNDDKDILDIRARQFVVLGNMSSGRIMVNGKPLDMPWQPLNVHI